MVRQLAAALALVMMATGTLSASPRNFIIILADDQGYADLGCFGSKTIKTPNIDRLAAEGMRFTSYYSASSVCTPSRAAMLTGRYPKRVNLPSVLFPRSTTGLDPQEITIAEMLKAKGYITGCIGKWHLGHQKKYLPLNQGFDSYFGIPYSNDMSIAKELAIAPNVKLNEGVTREKMEADRKRYLKEYKKMRGKVPLMRDNAIIEYPADQATLTLRYTQEAQRFIRTNKDKPFFLYLAHTMPHRPLHIRPELRGKSKGGLYGDVIQEIDWSVGEIVKTLKECGLDRNTFLIYTSDNGPAHGGGGSAEPLRGTKFTTFEGGHREPTVAWSPGVVKAGAVSDAVVSSIDLFPTIAHYAGAQLPTDRTYDGRNIASILDGSSTISPHEDFYFYTANSKTIDGVRVGEWKLLKKGDRKRKPSIQLYNLKTDICEARNVAPEHPEKVNELEKRMKTFDAAVVRP